MKHFLNNKFNSCPVWIPYHWYLASALPSEKGTDNRMANRILDYIDIVALSHAHNGTKGSKKYCKFKREKQHLLPAANHMKW
jgi:hypothetical protein